MKEIEFVLNWTTSELCEVLKAYAQQENEQLRGLLEKNKICYRCGGKDDLNKGLCYGCKMLNN